MKLYIGIDPGLSGGIAVLDPHGIVVLVAKMPETDRDLLGLLTVHAVTGADDFTGLGGETSRAALEKVGGMPGMGGPSMFKFGANYGAVRMALAAARVAFDEVTPQRWQKALGCLTHGDKNISKQRAQQLFPRLTVTHAVADALLLAEYCRRLHTGRLDTTSVKVDHGKNKEGGTEETGIRPPTIEEALAFIKDREGRTRTAPQEPAAPRHGSRPQPGPQSRVPVHRRRA